MSSKLAILGGLKGRTSLDGKKAAGKASG